MSEFSKIVNKLQKQIRAEEKSKIIIGKRLVNKFKRAVKTAIELPYTEYHWRAGRVGSFRYHHPEKKWLIQVTCSKYHGNYRGAYYKAINLTKEEAQLIHDAPREQQLKIFTLLELRDMYI